MISLPRVYTIVKKDLAWAMSNPKLVGIMILPVFVVVFFSRFDAAATFGFSLVFVNAFVGIFSTSYLVIEEKNKGTLLSLLTSPLTGAELLLGKFLFNLLLCGTFSLLVILVNQRFDLLAQPLALLNILLFAGTTCFVGFVTGVFFKNEQEMSVLAPFLMVLFCFGDAAEKVSDKQNVHAFFPDFQLAQSVKDIPLTSADLVPYFGFSIIMFMVAFAAATFYTGFYFSNNREKRFSGRLVGFLGVFISVLVASGIYHNRGDGSSMDESGLQSFQFSTDSVQAQFKFDPMVFNRKTLLQSRKKSMELLSFKKQKDANLVFAIRDLKDSEASLELRQTHIEQDPKRNIISMIDLPSEKGDMRQWLYTKNNNMVLLREVICGSQIFQYSLDVKLEKMKRFNKDLRAFKKVFATLQYECLDSSRRSE